MRFRNPFRPTGLRERAKIVLLWVEGWSVRAIAQHTGTSVTTVYRWIRRWQKEGNVKTRSKSGRPRSSFGSGERGNRFSHSSTFDLQTTDFSCHSEGT
ncbi:hypothetical protein Pcinc_004591 [Petrolisthes cinctipes]|uniref:Insertion element IS150 protein InsJ-like helix-turn-helix domain-containing protein n=1 Tax=Petrolisthes cinctipes TaxID=88211 RepID=A0AAE1G6V1_PETCI|nr:hypothetical protein Pcinc_009487 [Petrolisthes cinctipes]KAK3891501.1 hypothetical protein Pcinc_004591 [Petrolisthes cinctipes]